MGGMTATSSPSLRQTTCSHSVYSWFTATTTLPLSGDSLGIAQRNVMYIHIIHSMCNVHYCVSVWLYLCICKYMYQCVCVTVIYCTHTAQAISMPALSVINYWTTCNSVNSVSVLLHSYHEYTILITQCTHLSCVATYMYNTQEEVIVHKSWNVNMCIYIFTLGTERGCSPTAVSLSPDWGHWC